METSILLQQCAGSHDFLHRQILKYKGLPLPKQYSEEIRKFALTLHFYSPKAYDYIRTTYESCLPHPRTLSKWYQNVNAAPGLCQEAFCTLEAKVKATKEPVICALVIDEMSIRKSLIWDPQSKQYHGRVNIGSDVDSDSTEVASQSFVFLLNCVNGKWKLPIAYFLITSLSGEQKAGLLHSCLHKCFEVGVNVISVTCDGPASNFSMYQHLGCNLMQNETFFYLEDHKIYAFIDPCHALKLVRNTFGDKKVLFDSFGAKIDYNLLVKLVELQESEGLHLATKVTKAHVFFNKQKMKVRLATQLLSESVADALEYCGKELKIAGFEDCDGTIFFVRIMNNLFDVLNSYSVRPPGWKKAICMNNYGLVEALFEKAEKYIRTLRFSDGTFVIESQRKTGFIGLIVDMKSALELFKKLVLENAILVYLPIYKFSQDHIELFFSAIRARGGFNNNPNAVQFRAAFKRLLIRAEIRDSGVGNCIPLEQINILNCSSTTDPVRTINDLTEKKSFVEVEEDDSELFDEYLDCLNSNISKYAESVVTYIAGFVARKLSRNLKCSVCESLLRGDSQIYSKSLIAYKTHGGLIYPSKGLENICLKTEKILKSNFRKTHNEKYYLYIYSFLIENIEECSKILSSDSSEHDTKHQLLLIKAVVKTYLDIRFRYFGKKATEKISFRNYLNKIILFRNE
ncbi:unnamed protein product [Colias eurytheme]|nr:unnamed protein product [Colias eurytheme]